MYKSKLQELCHQKSWNFPEYTTIREGPDHNPRFQATIRMNGLSFQTQNLCKSSKEAQNDAAKLAFDHFSSLPKTPLPRSSVPSSPGSVSANTDLGCNLPTRRAFQVNMEETDQITQPNVTPMVVKDDEKLRGSVSANTDLGCNLPTRRTFQVNIEEADQITQPNVAPIVVKDDDKLRDMKHLYKSQLQTYAQKRNLPLPVYSFERDGPPHASRFKCKVTIDGQTFESQEFFSTVKEAEHAAAKVALTSFSPDRVQEGDSALYKNLLQELAQKEGYHFPIYNTNQSGEAHVPAFVSTVEVEGESFRGQVAKTKKQAEMNAAKVAYITLKERKSSGSHKFLSPTHQGHEALGFSSFSMQSNVTADLQQNFGPKSHMITNESLNPKEQAEGNRATTEVSNRCFLNSFPQPEIMAAQKGCSSDHSVPSMREAFLPFPSSPSDCSPNLVTEGSIEQPVGTSTLSRNKVIVRPRVPNMTTPDGSTVLPISDDNWVAMKVRSQSTQ